MNVLERCTIKPVSAAEFNRRIEGLRARPLPVKMRVVNQAFFELGEEKAVEVDSFVAGLLRQEDLSMTERRARLYAKYGLCSAATGSQEPESPNRWNGHLVALVESRYLLDMSLDQVRKPERKMLPEPIVVRFNPQKDFYAWHQSGNCFVSYGPLSDYSHNKSVDFGGRKTLSNRLLGRLGTGIKRVLCNVA